jgi:hypothetical protein
MSPKIRGNYVSILPSVRSHISCRKYWTFAIEFDVEGVCIKIFHFSCLKLKSNGIDFEKERIYRKKICEN